jgi:hypothetical protein
MMFASVARAALDPKEAALFLEFNKPQPEVRLEHNARHERTATNGWLEFSTAQQFAEVNFSRHLDGITAMSIGGWFYFRRRGEQAFFFRGSPETAPGGERVFPPSSNWVKFFLGIDQHGFLMGCINGNSHLPFPLVTLSEVARGSWHQLVLVKDARGGQRFYHNGKAIHSDADSEHAGQVRPFRDIAAGEPAVLAMPMGGRIGEAWVFARELSAEEVQRDFEAKRKLYAPALPVTAVALREMDAHPEPDLWRSPITVQNWPEERKRIEAGVLKLIGPFPTNVVPLVAHEHGETDCGAYVRRKVSIQVQEGDRMPAWLLVPAPIKGASPPSLLLRHHQRRRQDDHRLVRREAELASVRNRAFAIDMAGLDSSPWLRI